MNPMRSLTVLAACGLVLIGTACEPPLTVAERPILSTDQHNNVIGASDGVRWDMLLIIDDGPDAAFPVVDEASAEMACQMYAGTFEIRASSYEPFEEWWCNDIDFAPTVSPITHATP